MKLLIVLAIFIFEVCLCRLWPDEIAALIRFLGSAFFWLIFSAVLLSPVLGFIAGLFSPSPPSSTHSAVKQPARSSPPARQPDKVTPFLLGLFLGWWIGGGPDDPST